MKLELRMPFRPMLVALCLLPLFASPLRAQGIGIEWEIVNRFAPFQALSTTRDGGNVGDRGMAVGLFETYGMADGETVGEWHARLIADHGRMTSPYEAFLRAPLGELHWDPDKAEHRAELLKFVKEEDGDDTFIYARVWAVDEDGERLTSGQCDWNVTYAPWPCADEVPIKMRLRGATLRVTRGTEEAEAFLEPEHLVIVGIGDSYATGEGNPDVPARWKTSDTQSAVDQGVKWFTRFWNYHTLPDRRWIDDRCHRSFFSHQSLTALKLASDDPHRFVTFLHYACTGAEIFDGMIAPQYQSWEEEERRYVPYAQVNAAVRELCMGPLRLRPNSTGFANREYHPVTQTELRNITNYYEFHRRPQAKTTLYRDTRLRPNDPFDRNVLRGVRGYYSNDYPWSGLMDCPVARLRVPDYLFLSAGGNDIGFADIVRYFLLPADGLSDLEATLAYPDVCPGVAYQNSDEYSSIRRHCLRSAGGIWPNSSDLIQGRYVGGTTPFVGGMDQRYTLFFNVLQRRLRVAPGQIVMTQYPDPLRTEAPTSDACDPLTEAERAAVFGAPADVVDALSPWEGVRTAIPSLIGRDWPLNLTQEEAQNVLGQFDDLRAVLAETATARGVDMVCDTRDAFVGYGWWQGEHLNFPNAVPKGAPEWWNARDWDPFPHIGPGEGRAIRTANDSVMVQPHHKTALTAPVHPNLTGHGLIADIVFDHLSVNDAADD